MERESKLAEENLREKVIELREQEKKKGEIEYERDLEDPPLLEIPLEEFPRPRREKKEKEKRREDEKARKEKEEEDEREEELREEEEARTRQVFNPIKKIFDERKRRVTDLPECGRVTLPKPLIVSEESLIEIRREIHSRTYRDYREEFTIDGEQKSNMEENEIRGLRSLLKRIRAGELLIIKTDKSGKFCIVSVQDYLKLGEVHTKQDKKITRETVVKTEKLLNSHSTAWCKIWSSGENHGHSDRIMSSKISSSENKATLYPLYKDHKSVPGKTRPVVTGCSSDTRGLSNSVSSFLESVANCNTDNFESISGEDMLSKTKEYNANIKLIRSKWEKRRTAKLSKKCGKCCIIVMVEECANKTGEHYHSHTDKNNKNIVIEDQEEQERTDKKAITVGERISCISGTIVDAEKEKEEQTPENILGESVPQELELWMMVEPQNKNKNDKSPSSTEGEEINLLEGRKDKEKAINVGERITNMSGTTVEAEKEKEEQTPENILGESVLQPVLQTDPDDERLEREQEMLKKTMENSGIEMIDWDTKIKKYREEIARENRETDERLEKASKKEKSWALLRLCKNNIRLNARSWNIEEESKAEIRNEKY